MLSQPAQHAFAKSLPAASLASIGALLILCQHHADEPGGLVLGRVEVNRSTGPSTTQASATPHDSLFTPASSHAYTALRSAAMAS
jgi:hypothetical protein